MLSRGFSILLGAILSAAIAIGARAAGALTRDGAVAAIIIGTAVFGFGGWRPALLLVAFFITSSLLTRWQRTRKSHPEHTRGRSASQVLANGAVATILSVGTALSAEGWIVSAFVGAVAASTADTWATEVGMLSSAPPRLITTWRSVSPGSSGGVTLLGTVAGTAGALMIAALGSAALQTPVIAVWVAGVTAMLVDSVIGATAEGRSRFVTNDVVNVAATMAGATVAAFLHSRL